MHLYAFSRVAQGWQVDQTQARPLSRTSNCSKAAMASGGGGTPVARSFNSLVSRSALSARTAIVRSASWKLDSRAMPAEYSKRWS